MAQLSSPADARAELRRLRDEIKSHIDYHTFFSRYIQVRQSSGARWQAQVQAENVRYKET